MIRLFVRNFVTKFGKWARWADLVLGIATVSLGIYWGLWWVIAFGLVSLLAFGFNLNGRVQEWSKAKAMNHVKNRRSS